MNIKIEALYGEKVFKPITYKLYRNNKGEGVLESEFVKMTGDYEDLLSHVHLLESPVTLL